MGTYDLSSGFDRSILYNVVLSFESLSVIMREFCPSHLIKWQKDNYDNYPVQCFYYYYSIKIRKLTNKIYVWVSLLMPKSCYVQTS